MANPSLQIGNDNWAIKEDNLLGYSTAGTRFVPQPITMTRATLGTRVNPSGLVEDVELLGSELVANGDFATDSDWTKITGWSIANGVASCDGTQTSGTYLGQTGLTFTNAKTYKVTYTVTVSAGNISTRLQGGGATVTGTSKTSNGTYTDYLVSTGNTVFRIRGNDAFIGTVDNVSVKEATINNLPRVDYTDGTSSLLVEPQRTNLINYSEDLSQWTLVNGTLTPNATVSPDGTQNAGKVAFNNTGLDLKKTITVVAGQTYTISFYIKLESGTGLDGRFYDNNNSANIEVYDYTSQIQGTEWSKITRSVTAPSGCTEMQIWLLASSSSLVTASFWGAQLEVGSYATSLIPTSGGTVTRVQETYTKTGISDKINSEEGVLFAEIAALANSGNFRYISLFGSTTDYVQIYYKDDANKVTALVKSGGNVSFISTHTLTDATIFNKIAIKYKENDFALWVNGVEVGTDTSGSAPSSLSELALDFNGGNRFEGKVKQLQVFKTALSDSELAALTS